MYEEHLATKRPPNNMKIAYVHDWIDALGGAEKVLSSLLRVFPGDLFTLVDHQNMGATTSFISALPFAKKQFRSYLPLFPNAIERFDLSGYDLIISSSWCVANGVRTSKDQLHISYCHTPMRFAWDMADEYTLMYGFRGKIASLLMGRLRRWDLRAAKGVDVWIANSNFVAERISRIYSIEAPKVIYPPVNIESIPFCEKKEEFYVTTSRLVHYKRIDLIAKAFSQMNKTLYIIGDGPERKKLSGPSIKLLGRLDDSAMYDIMKRAKGFVYAALEDFGIVPVEAQCCGTPVIGYGAGGLLETVVENQTGVFFHEQSVHAIIQAIHKFETMTFDPQECRAHATQFSKERFEREIKEFVDQSLSARRR